MQEMIIRKTIKFFGTISSMADKLSISRASIYRYLNGQQVPSHIAERIVEKSRGEIKYKEFFPWKTKYYTEIDIFPASLVELPLKKIIFPEKIPCFPHKKNLPLSKHRAICVDENLHLIYGLEHIEAVKERGKKSVTTWHLSLKTLLNKKYEIYHLIKTFDPFERVVIRNALEKFIGKRQGRRTDLDKLVDIYPQVQGIKTRDLVADALGFSDYVCRLLNKILQHASPTLINQVLDKKISISKAAEITEYLYSKQNIRVLEKRKQIVNYDHYKNRKNNLTKSFDFLSKFN